MKKISWWGVIGFLCFLLAMGGSQYASGGVGLGTSLSEEDEPGTYYLSDEIEIFVKEPGDYYKPQVAYNSYRNEYLVVWHNVWPGGEKDIYARRVSIEKGLQNFFVVATGYGPSGDGHNRIQPAVAYNASLDQYLVVYMWEASPNVYEIRGKVIPYNYEGLNPEFTIISWANRSFWTPRVVWNSSAANEYFVAWNAMDTTIGFPPGLPSDIAGHRISSAGAVINPGSPIILSDVNHPYNIDIVYHPAWNEYLAAWTRYDDATTMNNIYAARFSATGTLVNPPGVIGVANMPKSQHSPAVAVNSNFNYTIVWEHDYDTGDHDIYARRYSPNLVPLTSEFGIATWTENDIAPDISANVQSPEWFITWQRAYSNGDSAIRAFRFGDDSSVMTHFITIAQFNFWQNAAPAVVRGPTGFLTAYEGYSTLTNRDIYARYWVAERSLLPLVMRAP